MYFQRFDSPAGEIYEVAREDIKSLKAEVFSPDDGGDPTPLLDDIELNPIVVDEKLQHTYHDFEGLVYHGEKNPNFKNFELVEFKDAENIFSAAEIKYILGHPKIVFRKPDKVEIGNVKTQEVIKKDITIYLVTITNPVTYVGPKGASIEFKPYSAYFLKTKKGLYEVVPLSGVYDSYASGAYDVRYAETDLYQIVSTPSFSSNGPAYIVKIDKDGEPELIYDGGGEGIFCEHYKIKKFHYARQ